MEYMPTPNTQASADPKPLLATSVMFGLLSLPYEVLSNIVDNVDFDDVFNIGLTCKSLKFMLTEESICKSIVQAKIGNSNEARESMTASGRYASALRRAAKRREALATARPFIIATIGFGDAYLYCKGVLCYTLDDRVRILDLHHSAQHEIVVSIPGLLTQALSEIRDNAKGIFQVLYYSDNIVSCLYRSSDQDSTAWLISFSIENKRILVAEDLDSTDKIFVRNNEHYLYYGTHSELGTDGYKKWVIRGYDLRKRKWFDQKIHLPDMVGSELGSTICFEFHEEYFYALSNQTSFEVEEIDWTSFYHCIRFPLECPCVELLEKTDNNSMWRRQHQEGPIDDRWTSLRLDSDESTGELKIVESRKEWYRGSSRSQRTYYTTKIIFPDRYKDEEMSFEYLPAAPPLVYPSSSSTSSLTVASGSSTISANVPCTGSGSSATTTSLLAPTANSNKLHNHDLSAFPNDPLLKLLRADDNPHYSPPPPRLPQNTHPGNDGSSQPTFTLAKCRLRCYHTFASTYLDLVDDPLPTDWQGTQRLRLRAGSRKLGPPLVHQLCHPTKPGLLRDPDKDILIALKEMYREQPVRYWPAAQDPLNPDADLDAVYRLLNPPSHLGNVEGTADERSIVYVTGGFDKPQAIIFLGFDPAMKLAGLKRWGGLEQKGVGEGPHIDGRATGWGGEEGEVGKRYVDVDEADRTVSVERKRKGKEKCTPAVQSASGESIVDVRTQAGRLGGVQKSWAWKEKPMYMDIGLGYYLGL